MVFSASFSLFSASSVYSTDPALSMVNTGSFVVSGGFGSAGAAPDFSTSSEQDLTFLTTGSVLLSSQPAYAAWFSIASGSGNNSAPDFMLQTIDNDWLVSSASLNLAGGSFFYTMPAVTVILPSGDLYLLRGFYAAGNQFEFWQSTNRDQPAPSGHTLLDVTVIGVIQGGSN